MKFIHKRMLGLLVLSALAMVAILFFAALVAEGQQNWPKGENSGNPANEDDAKVVDGSDGDPEYDTPPEGPPILVNMWYNATGDDWLIESGDSIYRGNHTIDMKGYNIWIQGRLKLENITIINVTNILILEGGELILYEDGTSQYSRGITITTKSILVEGKLTVDMAEGWKALINGLSYGILFFNNDVVVEDLKVEPAENGFGIINPQADNLVIQNCTFTSSKESISVAFVEGSGTIKNCEFKGGGQDAMGILLANSTDVIIQDNTFEKIKRPSIYSINSTVTITGNTFEKMDPNNGYDFIVYAVGYMGQDGNTTIDNNIWNKNGDGGKLFVQTYILQVTVKDKDEGTPLEGIQVSLDGYYEETDRTTGYYTDSKGKVYFECVEYFIKGRPDNKRYKHATNHGNNPYNLSATDGYSTVYKDFDEVGQHQKETLYLQQQNYDFEPINFGIETAFSGNAIFVGEDVSLSCEVKNNGNKDATGVKIGFYIVTSSRGESFLGEDVIDISGKGKSDAEFSFTVAEEYANQEVNFKVVANYDNTYTEYDDTNNELTSKDEHINTKPVVTITSPTEGEVLTEFTDITGTVTDGDGMDSVSSVVVKIGAGDWQEATLNGNSWSISWNYDLNGNLSIWAKAKDKVSWKNGEKVEGDEVMVNVTLMIAPTVEFRVDTPDTIYGEGNESYTLKGTATPYGSNTITTVTVKINQGEEESTTYNQDDKSWEYQWTNLNSLPADGEYVVTVKAVDNHGAEATATKTIVIYVNNEATNPVLYILTAQGMNLTANSFTAEGYVIEDYKLKSVEYTTDGTTWKEITNINQNGNNYSWSVQISKTEFNIQEGVENYNVWFRASDDETTSEVKILVVKIPTGPTATGINLYLKAEDCSVSSKNLKQNRAVTVSYNVHKNGSGSVEAEVVFYIGGVEAARKTLTISSDSTGVLQQTIVPGAQHVGKKNITIKVIFTNDENPKDNEVTITTNAVQKETTTEDEGGGFLPGFELAALVGSVVLVAAVLSYVRKR